MADAIHVIAGRCTTDYRGSSRDQRHRGDVLVVCKPDDTVLVHDATGYQPVAWLTRPAALDRSADDVIALDGDERLHVTVHETYEQASVPVSAAGVPVGACPDCAASLVRAGGAVTCLGCEAEYGLPRGATVLDSTCETCDLPTFAVERGERVEVCLDRHCESLDERLEAELDGRWDCRADDGTLRVVREAGLRLRCEHYPDCETDYALPSGLRVDTCDCGLPVFETTAGRRCLDPECSR